MKKIKGFTLVELLAVIVTLSIILMVVLPSILNSFKNNKQKLYNVMLDNICRASSLYFEQYQAGIINDEVQCESSVSEETCEIKIDKLIKEKLLEKEIKNPLTNEQLTSGTNGNTIITATHQNSNGNIDSNGNKKYEFTVLIDEDTHTCNE